MLPTEYCSCGDWNTERRRTLRRTVPFTHRRVIKSTEFVLKAFGVQRRMPVSTSS